jgi:hypothetical protein
MAPGERKMSLWQSGLLGRYWHGESRENDLTQSRKNNRAKNSLVQDADVAHFVSLESRNGCV